MSAKTIDEIGVALYEECQDKGKTVAMMTESLIVSQFGFFPPDKDAVEDVVRQYKNTGTDLEGKAQTIINLMDGKDPAERTKELLNTLPVDTSVVLQHKQVVADAAVVAAKPFELPKYSTNKFGQIDVMVEKKAENKIFCSLPEVGLQGQELSEDYAKKLTDALFPSEGYGITKAMTVLNCIRRSEERDVDIANLERVGDANTEKYNNDEVWKYNGISYHVSYGTAVTVTQYEQDKVEQENQTAERERKKQERLSVKAFRTSDADKLAYLTASEFIESPDDALHVAKMLEEEHGEVNLACLTEEGCGFQYESEHTSYPQEFEIADEDSIIESATESRAESISENSYDYASEEVANESIDENIEYCYGANNWKEIEGEERWIIERN